MVSINIFKPMSNFLKPALSINLSNIKINFREDQESNPGLLSKKKEYYLCAMPPPLFNGCFLKYFKLKNLVTLFSLPCFFLLSSVPPITENFLKIYLLLFPGHHLNIFNLWLLSRGNLKMQIEATDRFQRKHRFAIFRMIGNVFKF